MGIESAVVPTRLAPDIQTTLAGFWSHAQPDMPVEILARLLKGQVPLETVQGWTELVRMIPQPMLRPSDTPSSHWHTQLARFCQDVHSGGEYGLRWRVHHCLEASLLVEAAAALSDFDYLYQRLSLGRQQAALIWRETGRVLAGLGDSLLAKELSLWEKFWRGRQFYFDDFRPHLTFLSLADGYAEDSPISQAAEHWLEREGPAHPWLRQRHRPKTPYHAPFLLEMPEEDSPPNQRADDWVTQILVTADGRQAVTCLRFGAIRVWDLELGESLWRVQEPNGGEHWLALAGHTLYVADRGEVRLWDLQKRSLIKQFALHSPGRPRIAVAGSRLIMRGNLQGSASLDVLDLAQEQARPLAWLPGLSNKSLSDLVISSDGRRVTALWQGHVTGWDLDAAGKMVTHHPNHLRPWGQLWADGRVKVAGGGRRPVELSNGRATLCPTLDDLGEWCEGAAWAIVQVAGSWHCWNLDEASQLAQWGPPAPGPRLVLSPKGEMLLQAGFAGSPPLARLGPPERLRIDAIGRRALNWKDSYLTCFDLENGHQEATLKGHESKILQAAISADGRRAVSVASDGTLRVWELPDGRCTRVVPTRATAVGVNRDGTRAVSGDEDGRLRLWDLREGTCLAVLEGHDEAVQWAVWSDQDWLITGDRQCFRVWDEAHTFRAVLERPAPAHFLKLSPCGRYGYCERFGRGPRGRPTVRDLDRGHSLSYLDRSESKPADAVFTPDSERLIVATQEGESFQSVPARLFEVVSPAAAALFRLPLPFNTLACDGRRLLGSSKDHRVRIWDLDSSAPPGHDASLLCMAVEGQRLITGAVDKTARVWDLVSGACEKVLADSHRWVQKVDLRGDFAQTVSDEGTFLWDLPRGTRQQQELFPEALSLHGRALTRLNPYEILLWSPRGGENLQLGPLVFPITACAFSPDGNQVALGTEDGGLHLWDAATGQPQSQWLTPALPVSQLEWQEAELLFFVGGDGRHWSWDVVSGTGTRVSSERTGQPRYTLRCGNGWEGQPLEVLDARTGQVAAAWPQHCEQALLVGDNQIVAALTGGELAFLQVTGPGPLSEERPRRSPPVALATPPPGGTLQVTPLQRLEKFSRILLVGTGGRSDMLAALPLYECLRAQGKEVFLAGLITGRKTSTNKRFVEVAPSVRKGARFEQLVAGHLSAPVFCFPGGGTLNRLETLRDLVRHCGAEALVLVEAGVETLLCGDEPGLGTAAEDLVTLTAAHQLELPLKMLVNLGMGVDRPKGVCLAYTLKAIAELTANGGFWGSLTLLPEMEEFQSLARAVATLGTAAWSEAMLAAAHGTCGGDPYVSPLLNLIWFFDLDAVARRSRLTEWLADKVTPLDVHRAITNFLTVTQPGEWMDLPI